MEELYTDNARKGCELISPIYNKKWNTLVYPFSFIMRFIIVN